MMRMRETKISLLVLALFLLKVSAMRSLPLYLPANETLGLELGERNTSGLALPFPVGRCGYEAGGRPCPTGQCCDMFGWCGIGELYCDQSVCQMQCSGPLPKKRCGMQALGQPCPSGECCRVSGWCGSTKDYCDPGNCQSQCPGGYPQGRCGWQAGGGRCPTGVCCSLSGWCGTTTDYCAPANCQSQCNTPPPPPRPSPPPPSPPPPPPPSPPPPPPPSPPPPPPPSPSPPPPKRCGKQAAGGACPTGMCCGVSGWCGSTQAYCAPSNCQSQCFDPNGRCGRGADYRGCRHKRDCCSNYGWCGHTAAYCAPGNCQSQCTNPTFSNTLTSSAKNRTRGIGSFLLSVV